jgi:hypothetical protein
MGKPGNGFKSPLGHAGQGLFTRRKVTAYAAPLAYHGLMADTTTLRDRWLLWRYKRELVRRYTHAVPHHSCNQFRHWYQPSACLRCGWRDLTGQRRRAQKRLVAWLRDNREEPRA